MARAVIFANGILPNLLKMKPLLEAGDFLIAADGGYTHLKAMGLQPRILIGDLDSIDAEDLPALESAGGVILRSPIEKDETDLELALEYALKQNFHQIMICAALGGRLDQTLGNLSLLAYPRTESRQVWLEDGIESVYLIRHTLRLEGAPGDRLSLIAWNGPARGIRTQGLRYPLQDETLFPEHTRGISNEWISPSVTISLSEGNLLCIHTRFTS